MQLPFQGRVLDNAAMPALAAPSAGLRRRRPWIALAAAACAACGSDTGAGSDPAPAPAAENPSGDARTADRSIAHPVPAPRARLELPVSGKPEGVLLRDLDGDGRAELAAVSREPGRLTVWREPPSGWDLAPARAELAIGDYALGPLALPVGAPGALLVASRSAPSLALIDALARPMPTELTRVTLPDAPRAIAVGTLAGDSMPSALCVDRAGALHVWDGSSAPRVVDGLPASASCLLLASDGETLVVGDQPGRSLVHLRLTGEGALPIARVPLDGIPRDLAEADVDGDGDTELLVAGGDHHLWTFGRAGASWTDPPHERSTGDVPLRLEVVPARRAKEPDALIVLPFHRLRVMHYQGTATEPTRAIYSGQTPWDVSAGDWNGDGLPEVVIANRDAHRVGVLFGAPEGWRSDERVPDGPGPNAVTAGLVPHLADSMLLVAFSSLRGDLALHDVAAGAPIERDPALAAGPGANHPLVADADGDGALDLLWTFVRSDASGRPSARLAGVTRPPEGVGPTDLGALGRSASDLVAVRKAGGIELVSADEEAAILRRFALDGGALAERGHVDAAAHPAALATWTEDGAPRLASAGAVDGDATLVVVFGLEDDAWTERARLEAPLIPIDLAAADVDGDGRVDLALLGKPREGDGPGAVTVFLRGDVGWRPTPRLETGLRPHSLAAGDLDGDGRADLVVSAQNSHQLNLWLGRDGDSPLARACDLGAGTGSLGLWIGDLDGDGAPEIVAANAFSDDLSVIRFDR